MGSSRDVAVAISVRRLAILPLQLHVFNCVKFKDLIAFLCTSVLLLVSFREPGTSASPPINRKLIEDCLGFVEAGSNVSLLAHRPMAKFSHLFVARCAIHQLGHGQKDVIVVQLLLSVCLRASREDTIASSLLLGHSSL